MQNSITQINQIPQKLADLWQFSRPHTMVGTSLSAIALFTIAVAPNLATVSATDGVLVQQIIANLPLLLWAWVACLCGNVYIVGLNQLLDIEIDKINKPHLPLAAGKFSPQTGQIIVAIAGFMAMAIAIWQGAWLWATVAISLAIGTAYSLPPIRLKRYPLWASICIFVVRGVVVNLGLFLHFQQRINQIPLAQSWQIPPEIWALTAFVLIFTYVIAIFKDMPDAEGDAKFNILTLTLSLGQKTVFNLSRQILLLLYLAAIAASFLPLFDNINAIVMAVSHAILVTAMWWRSMQVDLGDRDSITSFYQFIWRLFYLEYIAFPAACLLA